MVRGRHIWRTIGHRGHRGILYGGHIHSRHVFWLGQSQPRISSGFNMVDRFGRHHLRLVDIGGQCWMQHPVGMAFNPDTVRNEMNDFAAVALSPAAVVKFLHTVSSGWLTGAVFVIGVSCWFLIKQRNRNMALRSIKVASLTGIVAGLIVLGTGDQSGVFMAREQPMKLAAAEGLQQGGQRAPFSIVPGIEVPGAFRCLPRTT